MIQRDPGIREMDLALRAAADAERGAGDAPLVALHRARWLTLTKVTSISIARSARRYQ